MKFARIFTRIFLCLTICFSILFTIFFGRYKITSTHSLGSTEKYKGILTLWQIDSFEGGVGSRKQFLLKVAREYEKQNDGILVMVVEHTRESLKKAFEEQQAPDMISFGNGSEIYGFSSLNIKTNTQGGKVGGTVCAVPWCRGGYVLIANPKLVGEIGVEFDNLLVSQDEYTQPLTALYLDNYSAKNVIVKKPMDAYVQFVSGKTPYFLGTQRDVNRLERRNMEVITKSLVAYNDLYQYVSITSTQSVKQYYSQLFVEYLISQTVQEKLVDIGMMSDYYDITFQNEHLSKMQYEKNKSTVSAFTTPSMLKEMQENSLLLMQGKKELEIKIKNMLV